MASGAQRQSLLLPLPRADTVLSGHSVQLPAAL